MHSASHSPHCRPCRTRGRTLVGSCGCSRCDGCSSSHGAALCPAAQIRSSRLPHNLHVPWRCALRCSGVLHSPQHWPRPQCRPTHRRHQFDICVDVLLACMAGAVTGLIFSESELVPEMQTEINAFMTDGMLQQQDAKVDIWAQPDRWISINLMTSAPTRCERSALARPPSCKTDRGGDARGSQASAAAQCLCFLDSHATACAQACTAHTGPQS